MIFYITFIEATDNIILLIQNKIQIITSTDEDPVGLSNTELTPLYTYYII